MLGQIRDTGVLPDEAKLTQAVADFKAQFVATHGLDSTDDGPTGSADVAGIDEDALGAAESDKTLETE